MVHLPGVATDFRSSFGFNGLPTANPQVDQNGFFDPDQLLAALDNAEHQVFLHAGGHAVDLIQWYARAGGPKALPKTHPGFVAAHLCATRCKHGGLCAHTLSKVHTLLLFRFAKAFAGYIKNSNKEPVVKKSGTTRYITPFNPNERDLKKNPTQNWEKYSDACFQCMRN